MTHHLVDRAESQLSHDLSQILSDEAQEVHDIGRVTHEALPQFGILCRHADRARIQMTDPHHDAAHRHEPRRRKPEFFGAEETGDRHVPAGLELPVRLNHDAASEIVEHERLMCFRQPELPGNTRMLDTRLRGRTRTPVIAADQHDIRVPFGNTGCDRPHTHR